jgi:hypothetical protein
MALWCGEASYISPGEESRYEKLTYLLHHGTFPKDLNPRERRDLRLKSMQYRLINSVLFQVNSDGVLLRCLERIDKDKVLKEIHDDPAGGHFSGDTTTHKILRDGYYWPTLFKDAHAYARKCKICQLSVGKERMTTVPLQPMTVSRPFEQWGLDCWLWSLVIFLIQRSFTFSHVYTP